MPLITCLLTVTLEKGSHCQYNNAEHKPEGGYLTEHLGNIFALHQHPAKSY